MNADQPNRHDLLRAASAQLLCAPKPGEEKPGETSQPAILSAALPAARAVAIALRDLAADQGAHKAALLDHFTDLYGHPEMAEMMAAGAADADIGAALNRRLARDIRAGRFDDDPGGLLRALLTCEIAARLRRSNPHFSETGKFSQPGSD